jgi:hypothetical protein
MALRLAGAIHRTIPPLLARPKGWLGSCLAPSTSCDGLPGGAATGTVPETCHYQRQARPTMNVTISG